MGIGVPLEREKDNRILKIVCKNFFWIFPLPDCCDVMSPGNEPLSDGVESQDMTAGVEGVEQEEVVPRRKVGDPTQHRQG